MSKIYFYGDSFTQPDFSFYQLERMFEGQSMDFKEECRRLHWTTLVSKHFSSYTPVVNAMGGWSNQDILVRMLNDLPNYTKDDIVITLGSEYTRLNLPSNLDHSVQQKGNAIGTSYRAKGYSLVGVPSTILAAEYEKDPKGPFSDIWKAGVDMYTHVTLPYREDYRKYWEPAFESLFAHIRTITKNAIYFNFDIWADFEHWNDLDWDKYEGDGHWSPNGWKAFAWHVKNELEALLTEQDNRL